MNVVKKAKKLSTLKIELQERKALGHVFEWTSRHISGFVITVSCICLLKKAKLLFWSCLCFTIFLLMSAYGRLVLASFLCRGPQLLQALNIQSLAGFSGSFVWAWFLEKYESSHQNTSSSCISALPWGNRFSQMPSQFCWRILAKCLALFPVYCYFSLGDRRKKNQTHFRFGNLSYYILTKNCWLKYLESRFESSFWDPFLTDCKNCCS